MFKFLILIGLTYAAYKLILPNNSLNSSRNDEIQEKDNGEFIDYEEID